MRRDYWIPIGLLLIVLVAVSFWGIDQYTENRQVATYLSNHYQDSFHQLIGHLENVETLLGKSLASASPSQNIVLFTDLWREAFSAQEKLNQLPIARDPVLETSKYLTQVGDFAYSLARRNAKGVVLSADQRNLLRTLKVKVSDLLVDLQELRQDVSDGRFNWVEMVRGARTRMRKEIEDVQTNFMQRLEKQMEDTPTLIYDGPFSDHLEDKKPQGLTGDVVDQDTAAEKVLEFIDLRDKDQYTISLEDTVKSKIQAYRFRVTPRDGVEGPVLSVDVSRKGGHVINMIGYRPVQRVEFNSEQAQDIGKQFLESRGYTGMVPHYTMVQNNIATVQYVYKEDDIFIYPDQIKVEIALDNGRVLGFDALTYYMSHRERDLPDPKISEEEARKMANSELDIESVRLALIPLENGQEVLTYEVKGKMDNEIYLIYINAETGVEERIMRVMQTKNGRFAI